MKPEWRQAYDDTMDLVRRRNEFCDRWREETVRDAKEGRISMDEFLTEMDRIKVEMDRTKEVIAGLQRLLDKLKIKD